MIQYTTWKYNSFLGCHHGASAIVNLGFQNFKVYLTKKPGVSLWLEEIQIMIIKMIIERRCRTFLKKKKCIHWYNLYDVKEKGQNIVPECSMLSMRWFVWQHPAALSNWDFCLYFTWRFSWSSLICLRLYLYFSSAALFSSSSFSFSSYSSPVIPNKAAELTLSKYCIQLNFHFKRSCTLK